MLHTLASRTALILHALTPADAAADKRAFTLFNPTPRELMRPMSADRPDATESPVTVDAGHVQLEMSFIDAGFDTRTGRAEKTRAVQIAPFNLKIGLLDTIDLQVVLTPSARERIEDRGTDSVMTSLGTGDLTLRLKHNLWGNDPDPATDPGAPVTALGVMPFITFPTGADEFSAGGVEGGIIVPFSIVLPGGLELGLMGEVDFVRDADERPVEWFHTVVLGGEVVEGVRLFVEYAGRASTRATYLAAVNTGAVLTLSGDLSLDVGVRLGVSEQAEDIGLFVGMSLRY
ncbi:MAG: transporter [Phycisphaerales bacterium]